MSSLETRWSKRAEQRDPAPPKRRTLSFHLYTLWLFTRSDIKTVILPTAVFAISGVLSGTLVDSDAYLSISTLATRFTMTMLWIWSNLLVEVISNQRLPHSVREDGINKPWRPLPAKRISPEETRTLLIVAIVSATALSWKLGAARESAALMVLTWLYNDVGGSDRSIVVRNILNALGLMSFSAGATVVAAGATSHALTRAAYAWLGMLGAVVVLTVHAQDLPDAVGDATNCRKTVPLICGDGVARVSIVAFVVAASILCPMYWATSMAGYISSTLVGGALVLSVSCFRDKRADEISWRLWCLWMVVLYTLPLFSP